VFQLQQLDSPTLLSSDPFSYLMYGRIVGIHGGNPYVDTPVAFPGDPVLRLVYWQHVPSFYGPIWTVISTGVALAAGDNIGFGILLMRSIAAAAAVSCGALVWLALRPAGPAAATMAAALWLWNPLVPLESGMGGHNDPLLVVLLVSAFVCARSGRAVATGATWAAAAFVKVSAILLLPVLAWMLIRRDRSARGSGKRLAAAAGGAALVVLGLLALGRSPVEGTGVVGAVGGDTDRYTNSVHELVLAGVRLALGEHPDDVRTPLDFRHRLAQLAEPSGLWTGSGEGSRLIASLPSGTSLLVIAPVERGWSRIQETETGRRGYISADRLLPLVVELNDTVAAEQWADRDPLRVANRLTRGVAYAIFAGCVIAIAFALWRGSSPERAATVLLLAFLLLSATWIWPWYLLWPLAFAALSPISRVVHLTVSVSIGSLLIYPLFGYQGTEAWWAYNLRSILVWLVPVLVFVAWDRFRRARSRSEAAITTQPSLPGAR
jgi:hypothetical protein